MKAQAQKGFTLIELMIVVAIIGILAAIALPAYQNYTKRAAYAEVVEAMASVKTAVTVCYNEQGSFANCDTAAKLNITLPSGKATGALKTITLTATTAVINATPNAYKGIAATDTCALTPVDAQGVVTWTFSGTCVDNNYVKANG